MAPHTFAALSLSTSYPYGTPTQSSNSILKVANDTEGASVTLSCNYTGGTSSELFWYQQFPGSRPEYILFIMESGFNRTADPALPGVTVHIVKDMKHVHMKISPVKVFHSALYYCALRPTVTGNYKRDDKNLTGVGGIYFKPDRNRWYFL
ncbi:hypothetical protein ACEWY4_007062 [Coilia grayii]|uniref:Ig-like domain-containing protein n=1 Tax=Coilia grayii TaxID=363190 RepID=A0ABD1KF62_9TELE